MANTILEKLQEKYPNAEGINDARNIAEAVGAINGSGGRGANAIADQFSLVSDKSTDPTVGVGEVDYMTLRS
jgi:hypothetical protein